MAERRQTRNQIRGPHSALTDFLASNNISAAQIHQNHQRRLREFEDQSAVERRDNGPDDNEDGEYRRVGESAEDRKKRKRKEAVAFAKIKQSKEFARRKARRMGGPDDADDELAREMMHERSRPLPGQLENCEICGKRFTVTPYSKAGPQGGLLCAKCSKALADDEKKPKANRRGARSGRRQNQSNLLDGLAQQGALSLAEMCTKKVADNINDIEEFGDLPSQLLHRLSQILCKRRVLTPRTLNLFLRPDLDSIDIYDAARLETHDFEKIFALMPKLSHVNIRFAGQLKNKVIEYMLDRNLNVKRLQLDAANLVSDAYWQQLFQKLGPQLEILKLSNLDFSLDDDTVEVMCRFCTSLQRLKLKQCWKAGNRSLQAISELTSLEHLSLDYVREVETEILLATISRISPRLQTLSLEGFSNADDRLLGIIHDNCRALTKLRFSDNAVCTDRGFVNLFTGWANPPLEIVDLSSTRDVDNTNPDGPKDATGLASQGLVALMNHSGSKLQKLNIASCRHVSHSALEEVFSAGTTYPDLKELDVSFHIVVDDYVVGRIFQCCPKLQKLVAFACFNLRDAQVPAGVALIGGLKAQDPIVLQGDY
ncbi:leucine rich repeat protein [Aspergillus sclerotiicarbonarius CBS 121057]|uniref:Leucine rich repeat protein n=1 Tax=Aspergillus sclerotiicarbonarius (strain CBS 121057 / IBT 28362) TaxID=1448318 RepID=A0A319F4I3_ASPSB|nr:leucine rich repeat protein [Aspergillus sclerotiicarbonarius CBS 121057]